MPAAPSLPPLEFAYGRIEKALAATFGVPESVRQTAFRSWIGSLQKLGLLGEAARVGRGAPLMYRIDQFRRLIIALELAELGAPPAVIIALVENYWTKKIVPVFEAAERVLVHGDGAADDVVLFFVGMRFRSGTLTGVEVIPSINHCTLGRLPAAMEMALKGEHSLAPRVLAVNLTARLRTFHVALSAVWTEKEEPAVPRRRTKRRRR